MEAGPGPFTNPIQCTEDASPGQDEDASARSVMEHVGGSVMVRSCPGSGAEATRRPGIIVVQTEVGLRRVLSEAGFEIEMIRSSFPWMAVLLLIRRRLVPAGAGIVDDEVANPPPRSTGHSPC